MGLHPTKYSWVCILQNIPWLLEKESHSHPMKNNGFWASSFAFSISDNISLSSNPKPISGFTPTTSIHQIHLKKPIRTIYKSISLHLSSSMEPLKCGKSDGSETYDGSKEKALCGSDNISPDLLQHLVSEALVWSSLHGLVVGDRSVQVFSLFLSFS